MLSFKDLKKLTHDATQDPNHRCTGTALKIIGRPSYNLPDKTRVWFHSFSFFETETTRSKMSYEQGFGKIGGADCWDDFTTEGQQWIKGNYDPKRCTLIITTEHDLFQVSANFLRLA